MNRLTVAISGGLVAALVLAATAMHDEPEERAASAPPVSVGESAFAHKPLSWPAPLAVGQGEGAPASKAPRSVHRLVGDELTLSVKVGTEAAAPRVQLEVTQSDTGQPVGALRPRMWLDPQRVDVELPADEEACRARIQSRGNGRLISRAAVDLNTFRVLLRNTEETLTLLDPQLAMRITKMAAILRLPGRASHWRLASDGHTVFVSIPKTSEVLLVDTADLTIRSRLHLASPPDTLTVSADGRHLWVGSTGETVSVFDLAEERLIRTLEVGEGPHHVAFEQDGSRAWVIGSGANSLIAVDRPDFETVGRLPVGRSVTSLERVDHRLYLTRAHPGELVVVDPREQTLERISVGVSLSELGVAPSGQWAVLLGREADYIGLVDLHSRQLRGRFQGFPQPEKVTFTSEAIYINSATGEQLGTVALEALDNSRAELTTHRLDRGDRASNSGRHTPMATTRDGSMLFVASPAQRAVFTYASGTSTPVGKLINRVDTPEDILLVDQRFEERAPGVYEASVAELPPGRYQFEVQLGANHRPACFSAEISP